MSQHKRVWGTWTSHKNAKKGTCALRLTNNPSQALARLGNQQCPVCWFVSLHSSEVPANHLNTKCCEERQPTRKDKPGDPSPVSMGSGASAAVAARDYGLGHALSELTRAASNMRNLSPDEVVEKKVSVSPFDCNRFWKYVSRVTFFQLDHDSVSTQLVAAAYMGNVEYVRPFLQLEVLKRRIVVRE